MSPDFTRTHFDIEQDERFFRLRSELGVSSFGLNVLALQPGQRGRIHLHQNQEEVYIVLRGELTLLIEGEAEILGVHDAIRVAPEVRRQLTNVGSEPCVLIALGGEGEHAGRDGEAFTGWAETEGRAPQELPLPDDVPHA